MLATTKMGLFDLQSKTDELEAATKVKVADDFAKYGLELVDFIINAMTAPEEVQKAMDARSSMGAVGNLRDFMTFQAANSMSKMAENSGGGTGGDAMNMGMGAGFGFMMPQMIQQAMHGQQPGQQPGQPMPQQQMPQQPAPQQAAPHAGAAAAGAAAAAAGGGMSFDDLSPTAAAAAPSDPKSLLKSVADGAGWVIREDGDLWHVTVAIGAMRKQVVTVNFAAKDDEGHNMLSYTSICGQASPKNAMVLLKYNMQMVHGAFAVQSTDAGDMVVVQANQLADTADPLEISRTISAVAWQADKVEEKLTGGDEY